MRGSGLREGDTGEGRCRGDQGTSYPLQDLEIEDGCRRLALEEDPPAGGISQGLVRNQKDSKGSRRTVLE